MKSQNLPLKKEWILFFSAIMAAIGILAISHGSGNNYRFSHDAGLVDGFKSHRALYDISMVSSRIGSQIVNVHGQMVFEWRKDCDSSVSNHHFNVLYEYADAAPVQIKSDFSAYETDDGRKMEFTSIRKRNGMTIDNVRGSANADTGEVTYAQPEGFEETLPQDTFFPTMHSAKILEAIHKHQNFFKATMFDGSNLDGPIEVSTIIGKEKRGLTGYEGNKEIDQDLLKSPARDMQLAFFPLSKNQEMADYEMSLIFHENGVMRNVQIEYDDFTIAQKLVALESLPDMCHEE